MTANLEMLVSEATNVAHALEVLLGRARLDAAGDRSAELGEQVVRTGEGDDLEARPRRRRVAGHDEALLALLRVRRQRAVGEAVAVGLVDDAHDPARRRARAAARAT